MSFSKSIWKQDVGGNGHLGVCKPFSLRKPLNSIYMTKYLTKRSAPLHWDLLAKVEVGHGPEEIRAGGTGHAEEFENIHDWKWSVFFLGKDSSSGYLLARISSPHKSSQSKQEFPLFIFTWPNPWTWIAISKCPSTKRNISLIYLASTQSYNSIPKLERPKACLLCWKIYASALITKLHSVF